MNFLTLAALLLSVVYASVQSSSTETLWFSYSDSTSANYYSHVDVETGNLTVVFTDPSPYFAQDFVGNKNVLFNTHLLNHTQTLDTIFLTDKGEVKSRSSSPLGGDVFHVWQLFYNAGAKDLWALYVIPHSNGPNTWAIGHVADGVVTPSIKFPAGTHVVAATYAPSLRRFFVMTNTDNTPAYIAVYDEDGTLQSSVYMKGVSHTGSIHTTLAYDEKFNILMAHDPEGASSKGRIYFISPNSGECLIKLVYGESSEGLSALVAYGGSDQTWYAATNGIDGTHYLRTFHLKSKDGDFVSSVVPFGVSSNNWNYQRGIAVSYSVKKE